MTQQPWPERLARGVARELRRHRERRGLSAQELSDECTRLGMPIQRSVIANFENGRRASVGVAELLVFAAALKIPAVWLIAPMGFEPRMEFLPNEETDSYAAAAWFSGERSQDGEEEEYENPAPLCDDLVFLIGQIEDCRVEIEEVEPILARVRPEVDEIDERLAQVKAEINASHKEHRRVLERVQSMTSKERLDDSAAEMLSEAEKDFGRVNELITEMEKLHKRKEAFVERQVKFDTGTKYIADLERDAREVLAEFKSKGWIPPELGEYEYLLKKPERETPSMLARRHRRP